MPAYRTPDGRDPGRLLADLRPSDAPKVFAAIAATAALVVAMFSLASPPRTRGHLQLIVAVAFLLPTALLLVLLGKRAHVRVYEQGLTLDPKGTRFIEWSSIEELRVERFASGRQRNVIHDIVTLVLSDGTTTRATIALADNDAVLDDLRARATPHLLERAQRRIDAGEALQFGDFAVDANGVRRGGSFVPWEAIRSASYEGVEKNVVVRGAKGEMVERLGNVPNAHLLVALANCRRPASHS